MLVSIFKFKRSDLVIFSYHDTEFEVYINKIYLALQKFITSNYEDATAGDGTKGLLRGLHRPHSFENSLNARQFSVKLICVFSSPRNNFINPQ